MRNTAPFSRVGRWSGCDTQRSSRRRSFPLQATETRRFRRTGLHLSTCPRVDAARYSLGGPPCSALVLAGCGTPTRREPVGPVPGVADSEVGGSCVLYARAASGIDIRGDAFSWWNLAAGRYLRGNMPEAGAVLVLAQTDRLRPAHLAVVAAGDRHPRHPGRSLELGAGADHHRHAGAGRLAGQRLDRSSGSSIRNTGCSARSIRRTDSSTRCRRWCRRQASRQPSWGRRSRAQQAAALADRAPHPATTAAAGGCASRARGAPCGYRRPSRTAPGRRRCSGAIGGRLVRRERPSLIQPAT